MTKQFYQQKDTNDIIVKYNCFSIQNVDININSQESLIHKGLLHFF